MVDEMPAGVDRFGPMRRIAVLNPKGGCGKTTIATNLASHYARCGCGTALFDYDPVGASMRWLSMRGADYADIHGVAAWKQPAGATTRAWQMRVPPNTRRIIVDNPAGLDRLKLERRIRDVDVIVIPVLPSPIDMAATADFVHDLMKLQPVWEPRTRIGVLPNRVKANTKALDNLERFLRTLNFPIIGRVRETQRYVSAAWDGTGVNEGGDNRHRSDQKCWDNIVHWIEQELESALAGGGFPVKNDRPEIHNTPASH